MREKNISCIYGIRISTEWNFEYSLYEIINNTNRIYRTSKNLVIELKKKLNDIRILSLSYDNTGIIVDGVLSEIKGDPVEIVTFHNDINYIIMYIKYFLRKCNANDLIYE